MGDEREQAIKDVLVTFGATAETISRDGLVGEIVRALDRLAAMRSGAPPEDDG